MKKGTVYLVGAGPGDYRLITLKGLQCIQEADVIVHDRLADPRLLSFAKPDVELVYVGKESSLHTMRQEEINQVLVDQAKAGNRVLRLKGGDPYVFGRGGEEAIFCLQHGVPFEEVPGITSAIAVPAYAGIPVTHRGIASSFSVITGHEDPAKTETSICWQSLATATDTLVFLMGMENLAHITKRLVENGRPITTPAAVIRWGTKPEQEVLVGTLENIEQLVREHNFKPPAIIIVGEVVKLREQLRWFDSRLLFGKRIVVTRARAQASDLIELLEEHGAECLQYPTIVIEELDDYREIDAAIAELNTYQWIVFTSVNGVDHFYKRLAHAGKDSRALGQAKIAAIGSQTAEALTKQGIKPDFVPTEFRAEGLLAGFAADLTGVRILIPRAEEAREILPEELGKRGADVNVVPVYRTAITMDEADSLVQALQAGRVDAITFTSSSTVKNFLHILEGQAVEQLTKDIIIAAIGPITADTAKAAGLRVDVVAREYTIKGLTEVLVESLAKVN